MRRAARFWIFVAAAVVGAAIAAALVVPHLIDPERYRGLIEERATRAVGREVTIGAIGVSLFPGIALRLDQLAIAGSPQSGTDLLSAETVKLEAALLPLLRGRLEVGALELEKPQLHLVRDESGSWDIARLIDERRKANDEDRADGVEPGGSDPRGAGADGAAGSPRGDQAARFAIDRVELTEARVSIEDRSGSPAMNLVLEPVSGTIDLGSASPEHAHLRGDLDLGKVKATLPSPGGAREVAIDVAARFDVATERGTEVIRIGELAVDLDGNELELEGVVEKLDADSRRLDLTLQPARIEGDRLAAFLALVLPDLPFSFSSPRPLEVEAKIHGVTGGERRPAIDGHARLDDVRFDHDAMTLPIEHLSADIALSGQNLTAKQFAAVLGETDLRGALRVEGFKRPRVRFDLDSRRANLDQLFGALASSGPEAAGDRDGSADDLLQRVVAAGRIHADEATWGDLEASDLDGTLRLADGAVTLEPLTASLYAGRFDGRVDAWPGRDPLPFRVDGKAENVRVEEFLEGALGIEDRLNGRFSGTVDTSGVAGEWATVARSLEGAGAMRIDDGEVESFPLLKSVATLSGVLGEDGLARIANRLAESATRFSVLSGDFQLDGGAMRFDPLVLESADFTLRGKGAVDLVAAAIDGRGAMAFSTEISELMRREDSRAAELFWSEAASRTGEGAAGAGHVNLPLSIRGVLSDPSARVDWESAARSYAERRLGKEVERQVGKLLDRLLGGEETPTPEPRER